MSRGRLAGFEWHQIASSVAYSFQGYFPFLFSDGEFLFAIVFSRDSFKL